MSRHMYEADRAFTPRPHPDPDPDPDDRLRAARAEGFAEGASAALREAVHRCEAAADGAVTFAARTAILALARSLAKLRMEDS